MATGADELQANNLALRHVARALARLEVEEFHWREALNGAGRALEEAEDFEPDGL